MGQGGSEETGGAQGSARRAGEPAGAPGRRERGGARHWRHAIGPRSREPPLRARPRPAEGSLRPQRRAGSGGATPGPVRAAASRALSGERRLAEPRLEEGNAPRREFRGLHPPAGSADLGTREVARSSPCPAATDSGGVPVSISLPARPTFLPSPGLS